MLARFFEWCKMKMRMVSLQLVEHKLGKHLKTKVLCHCYWRIEQRNCLRSRCQTAAGLQLQGSFVEIVTGVWPLVESTTAVCLILRLNVVTEEAGKGRGGKKFTLLIRSGYWTGSQLTDLHTCPARFGRGKTWSERREERGEKNQIGGMKMTGVLQSSKGPKETDCLI